MVKLYEGGVYLLNGEELIEEKESARVEQITGRKISIEEARKNTIAYSILKAHNTSDSMENLKVRFDSMASHDITFVGIIQTAIASGMERFPLPYRFNMLATASTLAVIAVFDAVSISLMEEKQFTKEHFYRIHPGGGVGKRLAEGE